MKVLVHYSKEAETNLAQQESCMMCFLGVSVSVSLFGVIDISDDKIILKLLEI